MTLEEHICYWVESSEYDLKAAENMLQSGYFVWCLFIGHLALEKLLKAIFVLTSNNKVPPKIHNLIKLAELSNINMTKEQNDILDDINVFHIEGRYAKYKTELYKLANKEFTEENFHKILEQFSWLKSLII
jgi:HEPN domain-containing protein